MLEHGQDVTCFTVEDHCHVAMPTPDRRFVHQQDTATLPPAMLRDPLRPATDQAHYLMPTDPFTAGHSTDRHHPHIGHQLPGQTPGELPLELGMLLKMTLVAIGTHEPAPLPHQRHLPIPDPSVANPPRSHIMHQPGLEPTPPTTRHRPGRLDLHHKAADRVHQHIHHTDPSQMQPDEKRHEPRKDNFREASFFGSLLPKPRRRVSADCAR